MLYYLMLFVIGACNPMLCPIHLSKKKPKNPRRYDFIGDLESGDDADYIADRMG